ncbi:hypothetical protein SKAU_G00017840 [Synaphobranchus kaupii]|uniref:Uncharacterized protein n=1 Tax=Synaphobranchus kaupii TaxID=118154 RepID=A0A9Q1GCI8_SYNKA|nr:hypothetical protein SKAU_G00017840 [Synaphobranchus kaupii]
MGETFICDGCQRNIKLQDEALLLQRQLKERDKLIADMLADHATLPRQSDEQGRPVFSMNCPASSEKWFEVVSKGRRRRAGRISLPLFSPVEEPPVLLRNAFAPLSGDVPAPGSSSTAVDNVTTSALHGCDPAVSVAAPTPPHCLDSLHREDLGKCPQRCNGADRERPFTSRPFSHGDRNHVFERQSEGEINRNQPEAMKYQPLTCVRPSQRDVRYTASTRGGNRSARSTEKDLDLKMAVNKELNFFPRMRFSEQKPRETA